MLKELEPEHDYLLFKSLLSPGLGLESYPYIV